MANTIFLIGHGIQHRWGHEKVVPPDVTLNFAVREGWSSTGGVSTRHLRGDLNIYAETIGAYGSYHEHYLCADVPTIHERKLEAFVAGKVNGARGKNCWMVSVRGRSNVALSAIIARLTRVGLSRPINIVWTCCRAPIGGVSLGSVEYEHGGLVYKRSSGEKGVVTLPLRPDQKVYNGWADGILTVLNATDVHGKGGKLKMKWKIGSNGDLLGESELFGDPFKGTEALQMGNPAFGF